MFYILILSCLLWTPFVNADDIKISPTAYRHTETKQEVVEIDVKDTQEQLKAAQATMDEHAKSRDINIHEREEYWDTILDQDQANIDALQAQINTGKSLGIETSKIN